MKKNANMITAVVPMNPRCSDTAAKMKSLSFTGTVTYIPVLLPVRPPEAIAYCDCRRLYSALGSEPLKTSERIRSYWYCTR